MQKIYLAAAFLLLGISMSYAQTLYVKVLPGEDLVDGDVYVVTDRNCQYAMDTIQSSDHIAYSVPFTTYDDSTLIGTVDYDVSESHPYEITFNINENVSDDVCYSMHTAQGYIYHDDNFYIYTRTDLLKGENYYVTYEFTTSWHYPRIHSYANSDYCLKTMSDHDDQFRYEKSGGNICLFHKLGGTDTIHATITDVGYATLYYSDKNLVVPEGVKAYMMCLKNDTLGVPKTYRPNYIIPKNTGVVLVGDPGTYVFYVVNPVPNKTKKNDLRGTDEDTQLEESEDSLYYMLSLDANSTPGSVGFYWGAEDGKAFVNKAHKAYFKFPKTSTTSAKSAFLFSDITSWESTDDDNETSVNDTTTGIKACRSDENDESDDTYYTISGIKVDEPTSRGIYIVNGKKIVVK